MLGCAARGIVPPCAVCAAGQVGNCGHLAFGHIRPGLQTGFCADTGGGWSNAGLVAHQSQLYGVPEDLSDTDAVTVEPVACAVHAVLGAGIRDDDVVAVLGAGTLGLTVVAALSHLAATGRAPAPRGAAGRRPLRQPAPAGGRPRRHRGAAARPAAEGRPPPQPLPRVRRRPRAHRRLTGGADVVIDCVGSADSIGASLAMVRPRGTVVLVGMPGRVHVDLASLWHREVTLLGAYAYGTETHGTRHRPAAPHLRPGLRRGGRPADRPAGLGPLSARALRGGRRPRRRGRTPRRGEGRLRPAGPQGSHEGIRR